MSVRCPQTKDYLIPQVYSLFTELYPLLTKPFTELTYNDNCSPKKHFTEELMDTSQFVENHIVDCLRAAIVEASGDQQRATKLRAQAKLRLVCMTDDEVWELAKRTCFPPKRSAEEAYWDIKETIAEYRQMSDQWLSKSFGEAPAQPTM